MYLKYKSESKVLQYLHSCYFSERIPETWENRTNVTLRHSLDLLVPIRGSLLAFVMLQQPRGEGSFNEGVLCHEEQGLESTWD